jgi:hypothetical protein
MPLDAHDIERMRRSVAMLSPSAPSGLNREEALRVLSELQVAERRLRSVEDGVKAAVTELVRTVRGLLDASPAAR